MNVAYNQRFVRAFLQSTVIWIFFNLLFHAVVTVTLQDFQVKVTPLGISTKVLAVSGVYYSIIMGIAIGLVSTLNHNFIIQSNRFRPSFRWKYVISLAILCCFLLCFYLLFFHLTNPEYFRTDQGFHWSRFLRFVLSRKTFILYCIYIIFCSSIVNSFLRMNEMMGSKMIHTIISGHYRVPREESRVFMFLDLNNSTSYAEKLGHVNYSRLLQYCFQDINDAVVAFNAEIYQYVGDEIVLSWDSREAFKDNRCVELFHEVERIFNKNKTFYQQEFGVVPSFKAGLHMGLVTSVEVGVLKREIAYHGDVLNTASRLQQLSKELGERILMSEQVVNNLHSQSARYLGEYQLKGKKTPSQVFTLQTPLQNKKAVPLEA
ncbi:MAG: adenylate/guanylate cyclase domain-containing protein [Cytophagales bacterium]|nr:adenylate/guanylate cyclase domain-containing protein [Cytophagales bacterium]